MFGVYCLPVTSTCNEDIMCSYNYCVGIGGFCGVSL